MEPLSILSIYKEALSKNKLLFFILLIAAISFVIIDKFMVQRIVFSIIQMLSEGGDTKKYILYLSGLLSISFLFQSILDYKSNKINDSLNSILLKRMTNNVYYKYERDIRGMEPQLLTTYFEKLNNCLYDITNHHKWRKLTLILLPIIFIFYSLYVNFKVGLISVLIIFIIYYLSYKMMNLYNNEGRLNELNKNKFLGLFSDYIYNLLSIYNNNTREDEINHLENDNIRLQSESTDFFYMYNRSKFGVMLMITLLLLGFIYIIIYKFPSIIVEHKQNLIIFTMIILLEIYQILNIFGPTSEKVNAFHNISNSLKVNLTENNGLVNNVDNFDINLVNICYESILNNLNLRVPYKQRLAIMGKIGCGKSTSVKLIMKLIKPSSGNIYLGNVDIENINMNKYRSMIAYIPQHIFLFDRSIEENLFYGSILSNLDKDLIINKYKINNFFGHDLKRKVGNNGAKLSGGQRQLLYILRHIIQPSRKIMILDEPTVSLDQNSKNYFLDLLNNVSDKTLIIITHDNDILKIMNRIIFLDKGKITSDKTI